MSYPKLVSKNPPGKKLRQTELWRKTKTDRGIYRNTIPGKHGQHLPLILIEVPGNAGGGDQLLIGADESDLRSVLRSKFGARRPQPDREREREEKKKI